MNVSIVPGLCTAVVFKSYFQFRRFQLYVKLTTIFQALTLDWNRMQCLFSKLVLSLSICKEKAGKVAAFVSVS